MIRTITFACLLIGACAADVELFGEFKLAYNKTYANADVEAKRFAIFQQVTLMQILSSLLADLLRRLQNGRISACMSTAIATSEPSTAWMSGAI